LDLSSASIWVLFYLVKKMFSFRAAYIAVFLFTASIYFNIISGLFILPDTPLIFFILLALYFVYPSVLSTNPSRKDHMGMILFGVFAGLALLSKYTAIFTWIGILLYILVKNRIWMRKRSFYFSLLLSFILMTPVIYWNISNHFISFAFHASRVGLNNSPFHNSSFYEFNLGQFFYQNPILFFVFILSLISLFKKGFLKISNTDFLLVCLSFPLILISVFFALFMNVLPHWSGPAFIGVLILCSDWLSRLFEPHPQQVKAYILSANVFFLIILITVCLQIDYGLFYTSPKEKTVNKTGEHDPSLDMYGWNQVRAKFHQFLQKEGIREEDYSKVKILSNKWFPAAHLDYYVAQPLHIDLVVTGKLWDAHKYYWINQKRKISAGDKLFYITSSQDFYDPQYLAIKFARIVPQDTIRVFRNGKNVKDLFIYEMEEPATDLATIFKPVY
jgi:hypothetical protein